MKETIIKTVNDSECIELAKRINKAREDIVKGKGIKMDVDNLDEVFES